MLSLPASKGFEVGSGFAGTLLNGTEHNDPIRARRGKVQTPKTTPAAFRAESPTAKQYIFESPSSQWPQSCTSRTPSTKT